MKGPSFYLITLISVAEGYDKVLASAVCRVSSLQLVARLNVSTGHDVDFVLEFQMMTKT